MREKLGIDFKLFKPISCIPHKKIPKIYLKAYPFVKEISTIILDAFADNLIDILETNAKSCSLDTLQLKLILKNNTTKDLVLFFDQCE